MATKAHDYEARPRLLARVVRSLLAAESFDSLADLTDALKWKCARLRIPWTPDDISAAFAMIASNTPLTTGRGRPPRTPPGLARLEHEPDRAIGPAEAAAILEQLGIRL